MSARELSVQSSSHDRGRNGRPSASAAGAGVDQPSHASDIAQFCQQHNIVEEFATAERLVKEQFHAESIQVEVEADRDSDDRWVAITVPVKGKSTEEALAAYNGFTSAFAAAIPTDLRRFICVSLDFQA